MLMYTKKKQNSTVNNNNKRLCHETSSQDIIEMMEIESMSTLKVLKSYLWCKITIKLIYC